ncbi:MAG: hypothetical protein H7A33_07965 [Deltaproteobacteria bacterium]|nr:hypothetical protein [Deltaproteobacteria bacterium]
MSGYICQLLINQEDYLFSRHLNRMVDQLVPQADRDFGLVRLSTKTSHAGEWIDTLQTPSLMFGDRLLVLEDIDKIKKSDQDNFAAFLKEHDLQAHLIVTGSKIDNTEFLQSVQ